MAALKAVCEEADEADKKAVGKRWPVTIGTQNITPRAYSLAILMDVRALLATGLNWVMLKRFVARATDQADNLGIDWTYTYRMALDLAYAGLNIETGLDDEDVTITDATMRLWEIKTLNTKEPNMATKKKAAKKTTEIVEPKTPTKGKAAKVTATDRQLGYLHSLRDVLNDVVAALDDYAKIPGVTEAQDQVTEARDALGVVVGAE